MVTLFYNLGLGVVKRSACSPSTPTIRVWIPLTPTVFSVKFVCEKNENKHKENGAGPLVYDSVSTMYHMLAGLNPCSGYSNETLMLLDTIGRTTSMCLFYEAIKERWATNISSIKQKSSQDVMTIGRKISLAVSSLTTFTNELKQIIVVLGIACFKQCDWLPTYAYLPMPTYICLPT